MGKTVDLSSSIVAIIALEVGGVPVEISHEFEERSWEALGLPLSKDWGDDFLDPGFRRSGALVPSAWRVPSAEEIHHEVVDKHSGLPMHVTGPAVLTFGHKRSFDVWCPARLQVSFLTLCRHHLARSHHSHLGPDWTAPAPRASTGHLTIPPLSRPATSLATPSQLSEPTDTIVVEAGASIYLRGVEAVRVRTGSRGSLEDFARDGLWTGLRARGEGESGAAGNPGKVPRVVVEMAPEGRIEAAPGHRISVKLREDSRRSGKKVRGRPASSGMGCLKARSRGARSG